jgi:hypothetical protein
MDRYDLLAIGGGAAEHHRLTGATAGAYAVLVDMGPLSDTCGAESRRRPWSRPVGRGCLARLADRAPPGARALAACEGGIAALNAFQDDSDEP